MERERGIQWIEGISVERGNVGENKRGYQWIVDGVLVERGV